MTRIELWIWMIVPIAVLGELLFRHHKRVKWWEILVVLTTPVLGILLAQTLGMKGILLNTEYWGGWKTEVTYWEDWTEWNACTHTKYKTVSDGDGGTKQVPDGVEHPEGHTTYHPPYWELDDSNGDTYSISSSEYERLQTFWGRHGATETEVAVMRFNSRDSSDDKWVVQWPGTDASREVCITEHHYDNAVPVSKGGFHLPELTEEQVKRLPLHDHPRVENFSVQCILGEAGPSRDAANERLLYWNALLGKRKQVFLWILIYRDQEVSIAEYQRRYWQQGNKNEFTLCLGLDDKDQLQWAETISWTEVNTLTKGVRNQVMERYQGKPVDLLQVVDYMATEVDTHWVRREFTPINERAYVPTPWWLILVVALLTIGISAGVRYWVIHNEFHDDFHVRSPFRRKLDI